VCFWFVFTFNRLHGIRYKEKLLVRISTSPNNGKIFTLQNKIFRITAGAQPRTSCNSMFKQLQILPVPCQYILSFVIDNQNNFQTNSSMHNINTRNRHHLCRPNADLSYFQKSKFYADIKILNIFTT